MVFPLWRRSDQGPRRLRRLPSERQVVVDPDEWVSVANGETFTISVDEDHPGDDRQSLEVVTR